MSSPEKPLAFAWNHPLAWAAIVFAFGLTIYALSGVLLPFVVAAAIAYLIDPLVDRLERLGLPRVGGAAFVTMERCLTKPCAGGRVSSSSRMAVSTQRCAAASVGLGAEIARMPPVFLGMPKRW